MLKLTKLTKNAALTGIALCAILLVSACAGKNSPNASAVQITPVSVTQPMNGTYQFTATGKDAKGAAIAITPLWSVTAGGGTINSSGLFTAGTVAGTFVDTVRANSGTAFDTVSVTVTSAPSLGSAQSFAVLGGTTVTNTGPTSINGDLGVSSSGGVTGYAPGAISKGTLHTGDAVATSAHADVASAYQSLSGTNCTYDFTGQTGRTLRPAVYCFLSTAQLTGDLVLDAQNDPNAIFIFQIKSTLTTSSGSRVLMVNGAQAKNVYWQVGSSATLGADTAFAGNLLAATNITLHTGAIVSGRALARDGAVTTTANNISVPQ